VWVDWLDHLPPACSGPPAPVLPRKHGGSGGARARTRPSARTAHRANGAGRDDGRTGEAARTTADGGWRVEYLKGALSLSFLAPPLSPNVLASRCPSSPLCVFLPLFHVGLGPSARASTSYLLCIFTLALVGALPTRDPRKDPIAHAKGKRYVVGRIWGMINWNIHGSVQFEILSRAVHQPVVWMQRRSPSLLVDDEMNG